MASSPDVLSASSNLYCAEDADDVASWEEADEWAPHFPSPPATHVAGAGAGGSPVAALLAAEADHMPSPDYLVRFHARTLDAAARQDAVDWILKVNEFYRFRPVTAYLSINYLDRFLSANTLPQLKGGQGGGWPLQLLSVACVSVAAKMEETHVPLLLDLQILEPRFVFEPRTVRRMELLLMAALEWRMRAVTPFDFLPHFTVPLQSPAALLPRAAQLILSTRRVVDFLGFRPSAIAAAAFLCAASESANFSAGDDGDSLSSFYELVSKEVVGGCRQLMKAYLTDTCSSPRQANRKPPLLEPPPPSPVGVLDASACGSCETQRSLSGNGGGAPDLEPPPKRRRVGATDRCTGGIEVGDDGKIPSKD